MDQEAVGVLKKSQVKLAGPFRLGPGGAAGPPGAAVAHVRIVQQDDAGARIEVTCPCGRTTYLQCDYAAPAGPDAENSS
jgi:hypothetical protein